MANDKSWWEALADLLKQILKEVFGGKEDKR